MRLDRTMLIAALGCLPVAAGCSLFAPGQERLDARLFDGMGDHQYAVTAANQRAQQYFDQGFTWAYAFNHDEAIRSFKAATRLDPNCAMAWWGIALCNGPHINNPIMTPDRSKAAWDASQRALATTIVTKPKERDLIVALSKRYTHPAPEDRKHLDQAYADAMAEVAAKYPDDADIATLYAEALMDLRPWDLWTKDGQAQPGTEKVLAVLERALELDPGNPGANHLYIHAVEASPNPQRADVAADRLRKMVPASSHLVHMPSHIDVLAGRWAQAAEQNERAIAADGDYRKVRPKIGFYRLYMAHNNHMLSFASMMEGRSQVAVQSARDAIAGVPEDYLKQNTALMDPFMGVVYDALKRFGKWDEILAEPAPPEFLPITTAMWRFHRGLAHAAKGDMEAAEKEKLAFAEAKAKVPEGALLMINPASKTLQIAEHMLEGEIALARKDYDTAVAQLRKAVEIEDSLMYMEPPEWVQPVRHTLGAVLIEAGKFDEAAEVYRQDLTKWPNNGWSLYGLTRCLEGKGAADQAQTTRTQFNKAWSRADTKIGASCLCVQKPT